MAAETVSFGGLSLVKKDGTHSQRFPLVARRYLIGRAEYCDIRINLLSVSREHAELVVDDKDQVHTPNHDNLQSCSRGAANGEAGGASRLTRGHWAASVCVGVARCAYHWLLRPCSPHYAAEHELDQSLKVLSAHIQMTLR